MANKPQNILHLGEKDGRYFIIVLLDNSMYEGIELFRPPSMDTTKEDTSKFSATGMLEGMTLKADLYPIPIGDNETIIDPRLDIEVLPYQNEIFYGLESCHDNSTSWPLPESSIPEIICAQHKKAELFLEHLMSQEFNKEAEAQKQRAKELLEKIINFDKGFYNKCTIKRRR